ncbi:F0F1 ATP synthase subunit delta [Jatrophihabitans fulvus]
MHAASRRALDELRRVEHEVFEGRVSSESLGRLADELYAVARLLSAQPKLRRTLADPAAESDRRSDLAQQLFGGQVEANTLKVVKAAVDLRWSTPWDLADALESAGDDAVFRAAEKDGTLDTVEDELFRLERVLDANGNLVALLDEQAVDGSRRVELLDSIVAQKVSPLTLALLHNAVRSGRKRSVVLAIDDLLEAAAKWQERSVARVTSAVELSSEQVERITSALSDLYGRPISARTAIDPSVRGGLVVRVGDEVIDGSVASRLAAARAALSG